MNITQLKKVLPVLMKHRVVPFIWGSQGIGKTQTMKQLAKEQGVGFLHLHLGTQCDVGDVLGLPREMADGTIMHARPEWFPTEGEGIVFLDELNRAHPDILQAMFSFVLDGTIHRHKLPSGWRIVAAGNYQTNSFNVTDTSDSAWMSRFCHIDLDPSPEEFLSFVEEREGDNPVCDFIRAQPDMLEKKPTERVNFSLVTPDRRAWCDMVIPLDKDLNLPEECKYEVFKGLVGETPAAAYMSWRKKNENKLKGKDILNNYGKIRNKILQASEKDTIRYDLINSPIEEILIYFEKNKLTDTQISNFKEFLLDVPFEMGLKVVNRLGQLSNAQTNLLLNDKEYVNMFMNRGKS